MLSPAALLCAQAGRGQDHGHSDKLFHCRLPSALQGRGQSPVFGPLPKSGSSCLSIQYTRALVRSFSIGLLLRPLRLRIKRAATVS